MKEAQFWKLIDSSRAGLEETDPYEQIDHLTAALESLTEAELLGFHEQIADQLKRANRFELLVATTLIGCGGDSHDGFIDFRGWLICQGQEVFERVLADPDELASLRYEKCPIGEWSCQAVTELASDLLEKRGRERPDDPWYFDHEIGGEDFDEDEKEVVKARFPRVWDKWGHNFREWDSLG